ncbi:LIV-II [Serratia rubidaea]|uniref:Branched-chain amino acid transport system carrier protein n=1 Tax=Serratia rubidaea TaxID=61652 RepID=A0A4V6JGU1_SERRU|nr:LIV-II [Serratia rubidaea]
MPCLSAPGILFSRRWWGLQSGEHVWIAALGFLITAVGLPVMTVIALARVGGGVDALSTPIGRTAGLLLATVCYLAVGPLFATPRTATRVV